MINRPHKIAILIELPVCFEANFEKSAQRKENRYGSLINDIQSTGFTCELITIEVGSRSLVSVDNRSELTTIYSHLNVSKKLSRTSVLASYAIFYSKYASKCVDPPLITCFFYFNVFL